MNRRTTLIIVALPVLTLVAALYAGENASSAINKKTGLLPTEHDLRINALEPDIEQHAKLVREELTSLDRSTLPEGHWAREWAGNYYLAGFGGTETWISIAPKGGVVYTRGNAHGLIDGNYGVISEVYPDGVQVNLITDASKSTYGFMSRRLFFAKWGDRKYLIPESQMLGFVKAYNDGGIARRGSMGALRALSDGEVKPSMRDPLPEGVPQLSEPYAKLLVAEPLHATVTAAARPERVAVTRDMARTECAFEMNVESNRAYKAGDQLLLNIEERLGVCTITKVDGSHVMASCTIIHPMNERSPEPAVGQKYQYPGTTDEFDVNSLDGMSDEGC